MNMYFFIKAKVHL